MQFTGRHQIAASPPSVWQGLHDSALLQKCLPGCERMEQTGPADFSAAVKLKIGSMQTRFHGMIRLTGQEPPFRCTLTGDAQDGTAGFASGVAQVILSPNDGGTELAYTASARLEGQIAQLDQYLVENAARQLAGQFFTAFSAALAPAAPGLALLPSPVDNGAMIWMTGLGAVTTILVLMFTLVMG